MSRHRCQGRVIREASFWSDALRAAAALLLAVFLIPAGALADDQPAPLEAAPEQSEAPAAPVVDPDLVIGGAPDAETDTPEHGGSEEILVTAQKRSTNIQKTPTAITALSGAQLFDRGIYDVESLATQVPNFQYGETFGVARITIR